MSSASAPQPVNVVNRTPSVLSNGNDFFAIYLLTNGSTTNLCCTSYDSDDNSWNISTLTSGSSIPKPISNAIFNSILVGQLVGTSYVVYQSAANQLSILSITPNSTKYIVGYTSASDSISNFCLYTDNTYLYIITNENGILRSLRLNGNTLDSITILNGPSGCSSFKGTATSGGQITALIDGTNMLHCIFESNAGITEIYQRNPGPWSFQTIVSGGTNHKSLDLIHSFLGFTLIIVYSTGAIDVYASQSSSYPYVYTNQYLSDNTPASSGANVGLNIFGLFISYQDQSGSIQCLYCLGSGSPTWNTFQLTGIGGAVGGAPILSCNPAVGVYNNLCYHVIYPSGNQIYDVFWAGNWYGSSLYPQKPQTSALTDLSAAENSKMF